MTDKRALARGICYEHLERNDPTGWFEVLYQRTTETPELIPWADLEPNPNMMAWLDEYDVAGQGRPALKVGCGLGDDAEALAARGFAVTAFDIAPTAIDWCRRRFVDSAVDYRCADLFDPPAAWQGAFDLVIEAYTLQVLPPELRGPAAERIAGFVAPGGTLLVVCRGREPGEPEGKMPWFLLRQELGAFTAAGLEVVEWRDYVDLEDPPVRRFRVTYRRPA